MIPCIALGKDQGEKAELPPPTKIRMLNSFWHKSYSGECALGLVRVEAECFINFRYFQPPSPSIDEEKP